METKFNQERNAYVEELSSLRENLEKMKQLESELKQQVSSCLPVFNRSMSTERTALYTLLHPYEIKNVSTLDYLGPLCLKRPYYCSVYGFPSGLFSQIEHSQNFW